MSEEIRDITELTDDELEQDAGGAKYYTVKAGDTLYKIAKRYGTTVDALVKCNADKIKNRDLIRIGWKIRIC